MLADAACRERWHHTSSVLAMLANVNRDPKKRSRPFVPGDFDPYSYLDRRQSGVPVAADERLPGEISLLKVFLKDQKGCAS